MPGNREPLRHTGCSGTLAAPARCFGTLCRLAWSTFPERDSQGRSVDVPSLCIASSLMKVFILESRICLKLTVLTRHRKNRFYSFTRASIGSMSNRWLLNICVSESLSALFSTIAVGAPSVRT